MFEYYWENERIGVYLDYSNMHYTKYNLWWDYNISQFINLCLSDDRITRLALYGAYDPKNPSQYNWIQKLKTKFPWQKNYFFFKKLETKWWKNKWNVDTEMWFDIAQDLNNNLWDCIILFTWDGDFLYPIQKIIDSGKKVTVISTKGHIAKELIDFINSQDDTICRYIDIHKETLLSNPIRQALRDTSRWISLHPDLLQYIKDSDQEKIKELINWIKEVVIWNVEHANIPIFLKDNEIVRKIIIRRHIQEKQEFLEYLETLL
jgi:uncharacterized LabA/DUF88 family protein